MREIHAEGTCTRSDVDILMKEQQNKETYTRMGQHTERILYVQRGYTREGDMRIRRHTHGKNIYLHGEAIYMGRNTYTHKKYIWRGHKDRDIHMAEYIYGRTEHTHKGDIHTCTYCADILDIYLTALSS